MQQTNFLPDLAFVCQTRSRSNNVYNLTVYDYYGLNNSNLLPMYIIVYLSSLRNPKLTLPFGTHILPHILYADTDLTLIDGQSEGTPHILK